MGASTHADGMEYGRLARRSQTAAARGARRVPAPALLMAPPDRTALTRHHRPTRTKRHCWHRSAKCSSLPGPQQRRFNRLRRKRQAEWLSQTETIELQALWQRVEQMNVERLRALCMLARQRGTDLDTLKRPTWPEREPSCPLSVYRGRLRRRVAKRARWRCEYCRTRCGIFHAAVRGRSYHSTQEGRSHDTGRTLAFSCGCTATRAKEPTPLIPLPAPASHYSPASATLVTAFSMERRFRPDSQPHCRGHGDGGSTPVEPSRIGEPAPPSATDRRTPTHIGLDLRGGAGRRPGQMDRPWRAMAEAQRELVNKPTWAGLRLAFTTISPKTALRRILSSG